MQGGRMSEIEWDQWEMRLGQGWLRVSGLVSHLELLAAQKKEQMRRRFDWRTLDLKWNSQP